MAPYIEQVFLNFYTTPGVVHAYLKIGLSEADECKIEIRQTSIVFYMIFEDRRFWHELNNYQNLLSELTFFETINRLEF